MIARVTPLDWPTSFARTPAPRRSSRSTFRIGFAETLRRIHAEMRRRKIARHAYVISSNLPLKTNGDPAAAGRGAQDPGIALYWQSPNKPVRVIACDQFWDAGHNLRAIGLTLEQLRAIERWGCTQLVEHIMQQGFALPPAGGTSVGTDEIIDPRDIEPTRAWVTVLGFGFRPEGGPEDWRDPQKVETRYHQLARANHPDHGGGAERMAAINVAYEQAKEWHEWNRECGDGL